ncbi:hypothetical protein AAKU55_005591 [Oxalobacteraceae bacterium GrIS 1.11]
MKQNKPDMRIEMPQTAAFIDNLREAFGTEFINGRIRAGMRGEAVFYATENGHSVGTPVPQGVAISTNDKGNRYVNELYSNYGKL